jgi:hypothetical protein
VSLAQDQPFLLQLQERFPDGPLTASKALSEVELRQDLARREPAQHDVALQGIEHLA